jgi:hypothetical protein
MGNTCGSPRPVRGIALFFYIDDARTSQGTHLRASTACYIYIEREREKEREKVQ